MIKAIIFDADNTLYMVVPERAYAEMFEYIAKKAGIERKSLESAWKAQIKNVLNSEDSRSIEKRSREYSIKAVLKQFGVADKKAERISSGALGIFWKGVVSDIETEKGLKETIAELGKKYALAVASDEHDKFLKRKLKKVFGDWRLYFKTLVSCEDAGVMKPSEKYFEIALQRLGIPSEEAVAVGDSLLRDIVPAKRLGIMTVLLSGEDTKNSADTADAEIKSLSELKSVLN